MQRIQKHSAKYQLNKHHFQQITNFDYSTSEIEEQKKTQNTIQKRVRQRQSKNHYFKSKIKYKVLPENYQGLQSENDQIIDWKKVELIEYICMNQIQCPICINESERIEMPVITQCGHIYCLGCYQKHSVLSKNGHKCPVCNSIQMIDYLKPVQVRIYQESKVGDYIEFRQIMKSKVGSALLYENQKCSQKYNRIQTVDRQTLIDMYMQYLEQLECTKEDIDKQQIQELLQSKIDYYCNLKNIKQCSQQQSISEEKYCFYQEQKGLLVYLHPLNFKYLQKQCSKIEEMPECIKSRITKISNVTYCEELKQRYKFLNHLPLNCEFRFIQVEMEGILEKEWLEMMERDIKVINLREKEMEKKAEREYQMFLQKLNQQQLKKLNSYEHSQQFYKEYYDELQKIDYDDELNYPTLMGNEIDSPADKLIQSKKESQQKKHSLDDRSVEDNKQINEFPTLGGDSQQFVYKQSVDSVDQWNWQNKEIEQHDDWNPKFPIRKDNANSNQVVGKKQQQDSGLTSQNRKASKQDDYVEEYLQEERKEFSLGDVLVMNIKKSKKRRKR